MMVNMMVKKSLWPLAMGALLLLGGRADAQSPRAGEGVPLPNYRIGPEDILQISVFSNEALSRTVPVRPDGMISLPLLNDVKAAGLTPMELREALMKRLVEFVPSPEVAVIVTEVRSQMISVIGQVMKPGRYDLKDAATIVDALALAGGFKEFASRSRVVVLRTEGGGPKRISFDYEKMGDLKRPQENFALRSGDIVMVP
jgi:polysaccharide export outer membrane protein